MRRLYQGHIEPSPASVPGSSLYSRHFDPEPSPSPESFSATSAIHPTVATMLKQTILSLVALAAPLAEAAWTGVTKTNWDWYVISCDNAFNKGLYYYVVPVLPRNA